MRTHLRELTVVGVVNALIPFTLFAYAALSLTAGFTALMNASTPLWTALVGVLWLGPAQLRAMVRAGAGRVRHGDPDLGQGGFQTRWLRLAVVAGLIATLAYGISTHYTKRNCPGRQSAGRRRRQPDDWCTDVAAVGRHLLAAAIAITQGRGSPPSCSRCWQLLALILYFRLISRVGGQKASTVTFLIPVFAIGWGAALLDGG